MAQRIEFGLDTFGDITVGPDGRPSSHAQVIRDVIEEAVLADQLGIEAFGVGEHHRPDFAISAPEVVLGAIAGRTKRIMLGSAAARSPSRFRCSATICRNTKSCSRKNSICSRP